jgi:hypothetical protein
LANKMLVTRAGEWMLPYWREKGECETEAKEYAAVLVSADQGATWKTRGMIFQQKTWLIENTLVETRGALTMYFRCALARTILRVTHTRRSAAVCGAPRAAAFARALRLDGVQSGRTAAHISRR